MEKRKNACYTLLARNKRTSFLHRIVTGDEKWIYFEDPKRKKSRLDPGAPFTSTARPNHFSRRTMICVWLELLKHGATINTKRYQQQLTDLNRTLLEKRPEYWRRQHQVIFFSWKCSITYSKKSSQHVESIRLRSSTPCGLLTRLGSFRLPLVCIDDLTHLLSRDRKSVV